MGIELNNRLESYECLSSGFETIDDIETLRAIETHEVEIEPIELTEQSEIENMATESVESLEKFVNAEQIECLNDAEVTDNIAEYLSRIENLKYENWKNLTIEQRSDLLNAIESRIAQIEHRPPLPIKVKDMDPRTFGYQDSYNKLIALNSRYVMSDSKEAYRDVIDTIIHEGRHAYQHYNVDQKCVHDSLSEVNTWRENFYDPKYRYYSGNTLVVIGPNKIGDVGFRLYYYQPVEIDARNFAADVMLKLKNKGFLS